MSLVKEEMPELRGMQQSLTDHRLEFETLDHDQLNRRFPGLRYPPGWMGVYDPYSGILDADVARSVLRVSDAVVRMWCFFLVGFHSLACVVL